MQEPFSQLKGVLSGERFAEYRKTAADDVEAIARYVWNARLCEALYPGLLHLEVALRNSLHTAISAKFPTGPWQDVPCWMDRVAPILESDEREQIRRAKERLTDKSKALEPGRMVAELTFGFWTSLLDVRYEHNQVFWPGLLAPVFPHIPKRERKRKVVSVRLNRIRNLRNRVFHYEPIWHWRDLPQQQEELLEAIGWLSTDLQIVSRAHDRFAEVYAAGYNAYRFGIVGA